MNGADRLCDVLLANDVDVCFANPGTSEMHFVAALFLTGRALWADALDWVAMAKGLGVEAGRATTVEEFVRLFEGALSRRGPFLIEAVL